MKHFLLRATLLVALMFSGSISCGWAQQNILLDNQFSELELSGNLRVNLIPAGDDSVHIDAVVYGTSSQRLKWKAKGGVLKIDLSSNVIEKDCYAELNVYYDELYRLSCDGVSVVALDTIHTDNLIVEAGSSINKIDLSVATNELQIRATGNSQVRVSGRADWLIVNSWLGARVDCLHGVWGDCVVKAQQSSEVVVTAIDRLDAHASGKASVFYNGTPSILTKESIGGAVVPIILPD